MQKQKLIKQDNLFQLLSDLEDFRRSQGRMHPLPMVLLIFIMAAMSGSNGFRPTGDFINRHKQELIKLFKPKNGRLPSFQTIARILENIDFDKLTSIFYHWTNSRIIIKKSEWCSLDGKAIGGTVKNPHSHHQRFTSLVSVFVSKQKQVLATGKVELGKKSEIETVKQLIEMLDLKGVIFSLDALHCQKDTVKTIVKSKNHYVIGVKGNQKKLHNQIKKT
jgi:hypothetical protein